MKLRPLFPSQETLGIHTDLYELTMLAAYFERGSPRSGPLSNSLPAGCRRRGAFWSPPVWNRRLHQVLNVHFPEEVLDWLRTLDVFRGVSPGFFDYLRDFRFSGDLWALPEGTPFFPHEPVLQVRAPVMEAQLLETYLIASISYQTTVATKASLLCRAARGRPVIDFGSRRAQGPQAGLLAARASFVGGCAAPATFSPDSNSAFPLYGTMGPPSSNSSTTRSTPSRPSNGPSPGIRFCSWTPMTRSAASGTPSALRRRLKDCGWTAATWAGWRVRPARSWTRADSTRRGSWSAGSGPGEGQGADGGGSAHRRLRRRNQPGCLSGSPYLRPGLQTGGEGPRGPDPAPNEDQRGQGVVFPSEGTVSSAGGPGNPWGPLGSRGGSRTGRTLFVAGSIRGGRQGKRRSSRRPPGERLRADPVGWLAGSIVEDGG